MRASHQEQTGGAGANEVAADFQRLGWGPAVNYQHDLGTDLFVQARDERRFDVGLIVGVQVKAGESYFAEAVAGDDGQVCGWWFRPQRRHVDYWLQHSLPHLVVLRDLAAQVSYWAHVSDETVESTGTGWRILVPKANVVDVDHREALLRVAASGQAGVPWEGSIWLAGAGVPPAARLRHALIVPRLIAPHPNAGTQQPLTPEQGVAMLMQARLRELDRFASEFPAVPRVGVAETHPEWGWRFFGALHAYLTAGGLDGLLATVEDAPTDSQRAASVVTAASALVERGRADEAEALLDGAIGRDDAEPVDQVWLLIHRGRARAEVGRLAEGREDAVNAQASRTTAPNDATASAIAAAAAILLFNTSSWGARNLEETITGSDTAASWWRSQTTSRGLHAIVERSFIAWSRDRSMRFGGDDVARNQLRAAALAASHSGDQAAWRYLAGVAATDKLLRLDRHSDPPEVAAALDGLRLAGAHQDLVLAVKRLSADGPALAVTAAAAEVDLDTATRTTGQSNLKLLEAAGDLLDADTANTSVQRLIALIDDPEPFADRTSPSYMLDLQLIETLAGAVAAADEDAQRAVIDHLLAHPSIENQLHATAMGRLAASIALDAWDKAQIERAGETAAAHHDALRRNLLRIAAAHGDEDARAVLADEAARGSLEAAGALGDARDLPAAVVQAQVRSLGDAARRVVADAHAGLYGIGSDVGYSLAVLDVWHPDAADWPPLLDLLADDAVAADAKRGALRFLSTRPEQIPDDLHERMLAIATRIADRQGHSELDLWNQQRDAAGEAALLLVALGATAGDTAAPLVTLLHGGAGDRTWAAAVAGCAGDAGILVALAADPDPDVRAAAAEGLARIATTTDSPPLVDEALRRCAEDPGTRVAASLAVTLRDHQGPVAADLLEQLRDHPSANVRQLARTERPV